MKFSTTKKIVVCFAIVCLILPSFSLAATKTTTASASTKVKAVDPKSFWGRFLIQTESYNKLWYSDKSKGTRYFIKDDEDLKFIVQKYAVKIKDSDLKSIPANANQAKAKKTVKYLGQLVYGSSTPKQIWYVNPGDKIKYLVEDYGSFYKIAKVIGVKVNNANLKKLPMNSEQLTYDSTFSTVAYARYDGNNFYNSQYGDTVLPLASLSKLMTALVLMDLKDIDWNKKIIITKEEIRYPYTLADEGTTSEVSLKAGDEISMNDLWIAMLTASSNQSAVILADNSGLSRKEFVARMNEKAKQLGLKKTKFYEMSGLNPNNITTPKEMAIIANAAFADPTIANSTQVSDYTFQVVDASGNPRDVNVKNRNYSLLAMGADASKTGFLIEAQRNVAIKKNENIIVVMHALSMPQRNDILNRLMTASQLSYNN